MPPDNGDPAEPPDRSARILLLTGREAEHGPLRSLEPAPDRGLLQNHPVWTWQRPDHLVRVTHVGPGPDRVRTTLRKIRPLLECDLVIIAGTAGALSEKLRAGTLYMVSASKSLQSSRPNWHQPEPEIMRWLGEKTLEEIPADKLYEGTSDLRTNRFRSGPLLSTDEPILEPARRTELYDQTGAPAVDMETGWILSHLDTEEFTRPEYWAGLRVISDSVQNGSPESVRQAQEPAITILTAALQRILGLGGSTAPPDFSTEELESGSVTPEE